MTTPASPFLSLPPVGQHLFSFAVIADTHVNADDAAAATAFPSGRLANQRAAFVVRQIAARKPVFVIHLGDMVHPIPGQPHFPAAVHAFKQIFSILDVPVHVVPGNHDVGDKPMRWMPSRQCDTDTLAHYRAAFGPDWLDFEHAGCRFVLLNASLINSGLQQEDAQWRWLETHLPEATAQTARTFVCLHYPPFIQSPDEHEHYDNLAEPGRSRLLALILRNQAEAVFSGHVHNIFVNRVAQTDFHAVPATSFVRQDFQEIFGSTPPDAENGRNDIERLGFYMVHVHEHGHTIEWVQSQGAIEPDQPESGPSDTPIPHPRTLGAPLGIDLRRDWARPRTIACTGVVDEFHRKLARNDYLTIQMAGLGLRHLRIPLSDLADPDTSARILALGGFGHRFSVYGFGLPDTGACARLQAHAPAIAQFELVLHPDDIEAALPRLPALSNNLRLPLCLSPLRVPERGVGAGQHYTRVHYGYSIHATDAALTHLKRSPALAATGFRLERADASWQVLAHLADTLSPTGRRALVQIRLGGQTAAEHPTNDLANARLVARTALAGWRWHGVLDIFLDSLQDHPYGYMPRHGLITTRCEFRTPAHVLKGLTQNLAGLPSGEIENRLSSSGQEQLRDQEGRFMLIMDHLEDVPDSFAACPQPDEPVCTFSMDHWKRAQDLTDNTFLALPRQQIEFERRRSQGHPLLLLP